MMHVKVNIDLICCHYYDLLWESVDMSAFALWGVKPAASVHDN